MINSVCKYQFLFSKIDGSNLLESSFLSCIFDSLLKNGQVACQNQIPSEKLKHSVRTIQRTKQSLIKKKWIEVQGRSFKQKIIPGQKLQNLINYI
jgi:hypothetical protein